MYPFWGGGVGRKRSAAEGRFLRSCDGSEGGFLRNCEVTFPLI